MLVPSDDESESFDEMKKDSVEKEIIPPAKEKLIVDAPEKVDVVADGMKFDSCEQVLERSVDEGNEEVAGFPVDPGEKVVPEDDEATMSPLPTITDPVGMIVLF